MTTTITSRDVSAVKRAPENGLVIITDHGRRSHVPLTVVECGRIVGISEFVGDRLRMKEDEHIDLPIPERSLDPLRVPER